MTTNIIEHLENIKIFTDYKRSGLSAIEIFWDYIEKGNNPEKIHKKTYSFGFDQESFDYNPSEEEIEKALEEKERFASTDWMGVYEDSVRQGIETSLSYDSAEFQQAMRLNEIYSKVISKNPNLDEYLATSEDIFSKYCEILGNNLPQKFFGILAQFEKERKSDNKNDLVNEENSAVASDEDEKINWLNVFEEIDVQKDIERQVYITTSYEQKQNYFSKGSFNLTLQYLHQFKKETDFLSNEKKLAYIKALDIAPPKISNTESPTFNQITFEARSNYYDFLRTYRSILHEKRKLQNVKKTISKKDLDVELKVRNAFRFMVANDPRKHKQILSEDDFDRLIEWISYYFINQFKLPEIEKPIKEVNTAKGNVRFTFKKLFKYLHPTKTYPDSLFELYTACFYPFREDNIKNFQKQSEPQFYKLLFKK